jgi:hypothetical protein
MSRRGLVADPGEYKDFTALSMEMTDTLPTATLSRPAEQQIC